MKYLLVPDMTPRTFDDVAGAVDHAHSLYVVEWHVEDDDGNTVFSEIDEFAERVRKLQARAVARAESERENI